MLRRTKTLLAAVIAVGALIPAGAGPAHAMAACQVKPLGTHSEFGQIVLVTGVYKGPATAVEVDLTCGVVYNGGTVARVDDQTAGPVAALADVVQVYWGGALTSCYEVTVTDLNGSVSRYDTCP